MGDLKSHSSEIMKKRNPLYPILFSLNVLGKLPLTKNEEGTWEFKPISFAVFRSVVTVMAQVYLVIIIYIWKLSHGRYWESFDKTLNSIDDLLLLNTCFHGVLATWKDTPAIAKATQRWTEFHTNLQPFIELPVSSNVLDYSFLGVVLILIYGGSISILEITNQENWHIHKFKIIKGIIEGICLFYYVLIVFLWTILCLMIVKPAKSIEITLLKSLTVLPDPEVIRNHRTLWVELLGCTSDLVNAFGSTVQMWMLTNFLINLLSTYGMLIYLLVDDSQDFDFVPAALAVSTFNTLVLFNFGHWAQQSISDEVLAKLFSRRWDKLSKPTRTELELFADAVECGSQSFVIKGLFMNNRIGLLSLWQTGLTYLVVLMQLKISTTNI